MIIILNSPLTEKRNDNIIMPDRQVERHYGIAVERLTDSCPGTLLEIVLYWDFYFKSLEV